MNNAHDMTDNKWNVKNSSVTILWSVIKQVLQKSKSSHSFKNLN